MSEGGRNTAREAAPGQLHPTRGRTVAAALALTLLALVPVAAPAGEVEAYLQREMAARAIPGLAWAAVSGDAIAAEGYLGLASVELGAAVEERSLFAIASLDKQLTAAGVLVLAQQGKLSLDDPLGRWVAGDWGGIRLRHLLAHTSGLPDSVAPPMAERSLLDYHPDELLAHVRGLTRLAPPGKRYGYSDAGLLLAQLATEAASGEPWRAFVRRELFAAAGMSGAAFMDPTAILPGRVPAYTLDEGGALRRDRRLEVDFGPLYNDLGMTVRDFARWLLALGGDRPLARESLAAMWRPVALADGRPHDETWQWRWYGLGVGLDEWLGRRVVTHSGHSGVGFVYLPELRRGVVVLTNLEHGAGSDPIGLAYGILGRLWPELALATAATGRDPDPEASAALRVAYEQLLADRPELDRWAPPSRQAAWEGAPSLRRRAPRLGPLGELTWLRDEAAGGELRRHFLAIHGRGTMLLRFALDGEGRLLNLTWVHL